MHDLIQLAQKLGEKCLANKQMLVTAESCTGGWVAQTLTSIAGSSQWFERGFVTYSNEAKQECLSVPASVIHQFGVVSEQTALAMAAGALLQSHADIAIATTGIAGPDGGSDDKPVGTVWFGFASKGHDAKAILQVFDGDRHSIREQAVRFALQHCLEAKAD